MLQEFEGIVELYEETRYQHKRCLGKYERFDHQNDCLVCIHSLTLNYIALQYKLNITTVVSC